MASYINRSIVVTDCPRCQLRQGVPDAPWHPQPVFVKVGYREGANAQGVMICPRCKLRGRDGSIDDIESCIAIWNAECARERARLDPRLQVSASGDS